MLASYEAILLILGSKVTLTFEEACFDLLKERVRKEDVGLILEEIPVIPHF
jgi:hypothetical protein